jgi:hypothetical protein
MKVILIVPDEGYSDRTWWRLFQKHVVRTKFDIYVLCCDEGSMRSYYNGTRGIIYIQPLSAPSPFPVLCSFKEIRARTYIQRHYGTELEFNQT